MIGTSLGRLTILQRLVRLPLWDIGRVGGLEWFLFGVERREILRRDGRTKIVSEYSLHVQCAWRLRSMNQLIAASRDRFYPAGDDPFMGPLDFDWDHPGANQLDQRISRFLEEQSTSALVVESIKTNEYGDVSISLNHKYFLEIFVDNSIPEDEHWRLFKPYTEDKHFVFTSEGIIQE
jgi:hypothetical protein